MAVLLFLFFVAAFVSVQAQRNNDDVFASNNDFVPQDAVTYDEMSYGVVPRLTSSQRYNPSSQAFFGIGASSSNKNIPPFENAFNPLNIKKPDLVEWGVSFAATPTAITHVIVTVRAILDDYTRSSAMNLGKDPGASSEAAAVLGLASATIIGKQMLSDIGTACESCASAQEMEAFWGLTAQQSIKMDIDGLAFIGDVTSSTGRRGIIGHTYTFNVSLSLNAFVALSNSRIISPADLATMVATAFARPALVESSFRTAAKAVQKYGYLNLNNKRKRSTARITKILASTSVLASGVASKIFGIARVPLNEESEREERNLIGVQQISTRKVVDVTPTGEVSGAITFPDHRKLKPGVQALRERKLADPIV